MATHRYIPWHALTDRGLMRKVNQDCLVAMPEIGFWAVLDGLGGLPRGGLASETAGEALRECMAAGQGLKGSIREAHRRVSRLGLRPGGEGESPATTVVALHALPSGYSLGWVGDSRAYLWDRNEVFQVTCDHTLVRTMAEEGLLAVEEQKNHPLKNVLEKALGRGGVEVEAEMAAGTWNPFASAFILASDGLDLPRGAAEISEVLNRAEGPKDAASRLVRAALEAGGRDNVTVAVIGWPGS